MSSRKLEVSREHFAHNMSTIKDINGMDLTEADDIRGDGKNTLNYRIKILMTQITMTV